MLKKLSGRPRACAEGNRLVGEDIHIPVFRLVGEDIHVPVFLRDDETSRLCIVC